MSEPKRYSIVADYQAPWAKMHEFSSGDWVRWEDYERLKAEVERLRAASFVTAVPVEQYEKLKAEVKRLRKAGDDLDHFLGVLGCTNDKGVRLAWNAAKEGRPNE